MSAGVLPRSSLSTGALVSIALHLLVVLFVVLQFSHPQPLPSPADLSRAIPISMEMYRPAPPVQPKPPKPHTPKNVVKSTAPDPDVQVAEPPKEESPPQEQQAPAAGTPSTPTYASLVAGVIQRNKQYPKEALENEQQGVVVAYFVVNHQGHVIGYRIEKSSGVRVLDEEIVRLFKRVAFPPIPDDGGDPQRREFTLPITFQIAP